MYGHPQGVFDGPFVEAIYLLQPYFPSLARHSKGCSHKPIATDINGPRHKVIKLTCTKALLSYIILIIVARNVTLCLLFCSVSCR